MSGLLKQVNVYICRKSHWNFIGKEIYLIFMCTSKISREFLGQAIYSNEGTIYMYSSGI